jgi:hypothetical protein
LEYALVVLGTPLACMKYNVKWQRSTSEALYEDIERADRFSGFFLHIWLP